MNFFGDRIHVYVANTTSSVLSIGQTTTSPHNMEWRLQGEQALIINHRTLDVFTVHKGSNNLYPLPSALFTMPNISDEPPVEFDIRDMPARSPKRIEVLDRTPSPPPTTQQSEIFSTTQLLSPNITVRPHFRRIVHSDIAINIPDPLGRRKVRFAEDNPRDLEIPDLDSDDDDDEEEYCQMSNTHPPAFLSSLMTAAQNLKTTGSSTSTPTETSGTNQNRSRKLQNLWHQRLGHPNNRRLRDMARNPLYTSRGFPALTPRQMDIAAVCDACRIGKATKITSHKEVDSENGKRVKAGA